MPDSSVSPQNGIEIYSSFKFIKLQNAQIDINSKLTSINFALTARAQFQPIIAVQNQSDETN